MKKSFLSGKILAVWLLSCLLFVTLGSTAMAAPAAEDASDEEIRATHDGVGGLEDIVEKPVSFTAFGMERVSAYDAEQGYYAQLDDSSKAVYRAILKSSLVDGPYDAQVTAPISGATYTDDPAEPIIAALFALQFDCPELSWLVNTEFSYTYSKTYKTVTSFAMSERGYKQATTDPEDAAGGSYDWTGEGYYSIYDYADTEDLIALIGGLNAAVNDIGNLDGKSNYTKAKAIHDWVCGNMNYTDTSGAKFINNWRGYQTAYSSVVTGDTVCAGYAKAYKLLCDLYDVPCAVIVGRSSGENHAWNYVMMDDDKWYAVDCTWGDNKTSFGYSYFLKGAANFNMSHTEGIPSAGYPLVYPKLNDADYQKPDKILTDLSAEIAEGKSFSAYDKLTADDLIVTAVYGDEENPRENLAEGYTVTYPDGQAYLNTGNNKITVSYGVKSCELNVSAAAKSMTGAEITPEKSSYTYSGAENRPAVKAVKLGDTLINEKDYDISYTDNINAGTAKLTVTGKNNCTDTAFADFSIAPKSLADSTVTAADQVYSGAQLMPAITVQDGNTTLIGDTDYTYSYNNNVYAGKAGVEIEGKGNYQGSKTADFAIKAITQKPDITASGSLLAGNNTLDLSTFVTGVQGGAKLSFSIADGDAASLSGSTLTSERRKSGDVKINVEIAAVDVNGDGIDEYSAYSQTEVITITVKSKPVAKLSGGVVQSDCVYKEIPEDPLYTAPGGTVWQEITYEGKLRTGAEYSPSADKPTEAGEYTVTVDCETADTVYTAAADFVIQPVSINGEKVMLDVSSAEYSGNTQNVSVVSVGALEKADYEVSGTTSAVNAGDYTVIVTGKGNYQGTMQAVWKITPKTIAVTGANVVARKYEQNSTAVTVAGVTFDTAALALGTDYSAVGTMADADAGSVKDVKVKVALLGTAAANYRLAESEFAAKVNIGKAEHDDQSIGVADKYGSSTGINIAAAAVSGGTASIDTVTDGNNILAEAPAVDPAGKKLTVKLNDAPENIGKTAEIKLLISSNNYEDYYVTVTVAVSDKHMQEIIADDLKGVYGDAGLKISASGRGALSYYVVKGNEFVEVAEDGMVTVKGAGAALVKITAAGDDEYNEAEKLIEICIAKRTINVQAANASMTVGGTLPTFTVNYQNLPDGVEPADICSVLAAAAAGTDGKTAGSFVIAVTAPVLNENAADNYKIGTVTDGTLTVRASAGAAGGGGGGSAGGGAAGGDEPLTSLPGAEDMAADEKNIDNPAQIPADFIDVPSTAWYAEAVQYVADKGLMQGESSRRFSPNNNLTRAMLVTVLYRMEGEPQTAAGTDFSDVRSDMWYSDAIAWASDSGIVKGYSDTLFGTDDNITREQMAVIFYNYLGYRQYETAAGAELLAFSDADRISTWAEEALRWAVGADVLNGYDGALSPQSGATRAEVAAVLKRFCENIIKQ